jgi:hypothetical protein
MNQFYLVAANASWHFAPSESPDGMVDSGKGTILVVPKKRE